MKARTKITAVVLTFLVIMACAVLSYPSSLRAVKNTLLYRQDTVSVTRLRDFHLGRQGVVRLINSGIKQHYQLHFSGDIVRFDTLYIGKGDCRFYSSFVQVTCDSLFVFIQTDSLRQELRQRHDLRLDSSLKIEIRQHIDSADIRLTSGTRSFRVRSRFAGMGSPFVRSEGSDIQVSDFSFSSQQYVSKVWIFGDSYVCCSNPASWAYWIYRQGYDFLSDGHPGGKSCDSYDFLRTALSVNKPEYLIWCLGMNDGRDKLLPNATWLIYRKRVEALCTENGITLIYGIVPTCPMVFNGHKNEHIRKSGYRFIDFEQALFDRHGKWKAGYCADNLHPTEEGAKAMAEQFLKDFPEIHNRRRTPKSSKDELLLSEVLSKAGHQ